VRDGMSVRELEKLAAMPDEKPQKPAPRPLPSELNDMQERLQNVLGVRTSLRGSLKKGRIILQYDSAEELEAIYEAMERLENE
jgi:ParB family transcriptional regulator, chromosome partitioning protein